MSNTYADTMDRYDHDAEFRALVDMLTHAAMTNGFTPGELKQAVFVAAYRCELFSLKSWRLVVGPDGRVQHIEPEPPR